MEKKKFLHMIAMLKKPMDSRNMGMFKEIKPIIEKCHFIKNINLPLSDYDKLEFCKHLTYKRFDSGDIIYHRGDENNCIYFILKGKVAVTYPSKT